MTRALDWPGVRSSTVAHLAWRVYAARYQRRVAALRGDLAEATPFAGTAPAAQAASIADRRAAYIEWWHDLVLFSDLISSARGRSFFHLVQPNQYDRGAKPLSAEERESFTRNTAWFDEVTPRYALVEQMSARLRQEGVDSSFLGDLFAATPETVYVDDCCHLNERGVRLLATAVANHLVASGRLARPRILQVDQAGS